MGAKKEPFENIVGKTFGKLTIMEDLGRDKNGRHIKASCECGKEKKYRLSHVKYGKIISCGCYKSPLIGKGSLIHGLSREKLYSIRNAILRRCYDVNCSNYHRYGGRGIRCCDEWVKSIHSFISWSINNGYASGLHIDREDNNGDYSPSNCRWVTRKINARNTRTNVFIEYKNEIKTIAEWCEIYGISQKRFYSRRNRGWSIDDALNIPIIHPAAKKQKIINAYTP